MFSLLVLWSALSATADDTASRDIQLVPSLPGLAEPKQQVALSVPVEGILSRVFTVEGDHVEPNAILASLDTRTLEQELRVAESVAGNSAALQKAKHTLAFTERSLARFEGMRKSSAVSDKAFDEAKTSYDIALANMELASKEDEAAQIRCDVVRAAIDIRSIRAPFAGRILKVLAQPGQSVKLEDTVAVLADLDTMQVDLHLPIEIFNKVEIGSIYRLATYVPDSKVISAKLISVEPVVNAALGTFRCRFEFDNRFHQLPVGFAVRLIRPNHETDWPVSQPIEQLAFRKN
jgi:RND family efflux transporter MFP subunit